MSPQTIQVFNWSDIEGLLKERMGISNFRKQWAEWVATFNVQNGIITSLYIAEIDNIENEELREAAKKIWEEYNIMYVKYYW